MCVMLVRPFLNLAIFIVVVQSVKFIGDISSLYYCHVLRAGASFLMCCMWSLVLVGGVEMRVVRVTSFVALPMLSFLSTSLCDGNLATEIFLAILLMMNFMWLTKTALLDLLVLFALMLPGESVNIIAYFLLLWVIKMVLPVAFISAVNIVWCRW